MDFAFANRRLEKAYFFKVDQELIRKLHAEEEVRHEQELQDLHWMKCPKCGHDLKQARLASLKVDRCTGCDGVFFDKTEWAQYFNGEEPHHDFIETLHSLMVGEGKR